MEIIAAVHANLVRPRRDGGIESESDLKEFSLGLTQCNATFGHGGERADNKIKGAEYDWK